MYLTIDKYDIIMPFLSLAYVRLWNSVRYNNLLYEISNFYLNSHMFCVLNFYISKALLRYSTNILG